MSKFFVGLSLAIAVAMCSSATAQQTITYKCSSCGQYHTKVVSNATSGSSSANGVSSRVVAKPAMPAVSSAETQVASPVQTASSSTVPQAAKVVRQRWNFDKANNWPRRIDARAQAWAQEEANQLARRAYSGYLQNGHPGGNNPYARVTGTGTTFPGASLIHTCEGSSGMTLVAEAAAVSHDGRIYGVRSWR